MASALRFKIIQPAIKRTCGMLVSSHHVQRKNGIIKASGFFDDLWNGIKTVASDAYNQIVKPQMNPQNAAALMKMAAGVKPKLDKKSILKEIQMELSKSKAGSGRKKAKVSKRKRGGIISEF